MKPIRLAIAALTLSLVSLGALAQGLPPVKVIGVITAVNGDEIDIKGDDGTVTQAFLGDKTLVFQTTTIAFSDIKPGQFVGTATRPGTDGKLSGIELHTFDASMGRAGEGFFPWDDGSDSMMANGTLSKVVGTTDHTITVTYNGGEQTVDIPADTPVANMAPSDRTALVVGAHAIARGSKDAAGKYNVAFITAGKDGNVPAV